VTATDAERVATNYVLLSEVPRGAARSGLTDLPRSTRVSLLRALGYAWLGQTADLHRVSGKHAASMDARAFSAAGDALMRLKDPIHFLVKEFAGAYKRELVQLHQLVANELNRCASSADGAALRQLFQTAIANFFANGEVSGPLLCSWLPIFLNGSGSWPADIEPISRSGGAFLGRPYRHIWGKGEELVSMIDVQRSWRARQAGQTFRDWADKLAVPMSVLTRMLREGGYRKYGPGHDYLHRAVDDLVQRYRRTESIDKYIDVATVMRHGMTLGECVRRLRNPVTSNVRRVAAALVHSEGRSRLMFAKWVLPDFPTVRVVVPTGYGGDRYDSRWASVGVAAKFLRVERDTIVRWVQAGRLGIVLPGVPSEEMGIPREALRRLRKHPKR
jgi:hypothetical protein